MNPLADLTQAPMLYRIGDKTYEISPFTNDDYGAFCRFAQYLDYLAIQSLPIDDAKKDATFRECQNKLVFMGNDEFNKACRTMEGLNELAYLSLRHKHKGITRDDVAAIGPEDKRNMTDIAFYMAWPSDRPMPDEVEKKAREQISNLRSKGTLQ